MPSAEMEAISAYVDLCEQQNIDEMSTEELAGSLILQWHLLVWSRAELARLEDAYARVSRPLRTVAPRIPRRATTAADTFFVSLISRVKHERANSLHARTLGVLAAHLGRRGIGVGSNELIDGFAQLGLGPAIFEIKSINAENERSQCRIALAQLNEYQYLHRLSTASLWIVLSAQPTIPWMQDYLRAHCRLRLVWVDGDELTGPDVGDLV